MGKTAIVIGGTGLVGRELVAQLCADERWARVVSLGRRASGAQHAKLAEHVIDFGAPSSWSGLVRGDVAFSTLGTTLRQAGSKEAQRVVDYDYQLAFAKAAAANGVVSYALCSSAGADARSSMFYARMKGELDRDVQALGFRCVRIFRPSMLGGQRATPRAGEKWGSALLGAANAVGLFRRYREIGGDVVARAMINAALDPAPGTKIFALDEVFTEAARG